MKDWITQSAKLLGNWDKVSAEKALVWLSQNRQKDQDEILMGYALARRTLDNVFARFALQKQTLSEEESENLDLAIKLARHSIPDSHPLLFLFLKEASHMKEDLLEEVAVLEAWLLKNA